MERDESESIEKLKSVSDKIAKTFKEVNNILELIEKGLDVINDNIEFIKKENAVEIIDFIIDLFRDEKLNDKYSKNAGKLITSIINKFFKVFEIKRDIKNVDYLFSRLNQGIKIIVNGNISGDFLAEQSGSASITINGNITGNNTAHYSRSIMVINGELKGQYNGNIYGGVLIAQKAVGKDFCSDMHNGIVIIREGNPSFSTNNFSYNNGLIFSPNFNYPKDFFTIINLKNIEDGKININNLDELKQLVAFLKRPESRFLIDVKKIKFSKEVINPNYSGMEWYFKIMLNYAKILMGIKPESKENFEKYETDESDKKMFSFLSENEDILEKDETTLLQNALFYNSQVKKSIANFFSPLSTGLMKFHVHEKSDLDVEIPEKEKNLLRFNDCANNILKLINIILKQLELSFIKNNKLVVEGKIDIEKNMTRYHSDIDLTYTSKGYDAIISKMNFLIDKINILKDKSKTYEEMVDLLTKSPEKNEHNPDLLLLQPEKFEFLSINTTLIALHKLFLAIPQGESHTHGQSVFEFKGNVSEIPQSVKNEIINFFPKLTNRREVIYNTVFITKQIIDFNPGKKDYELIRFDCNVPISVVDRHFTQVFGEIEINKGGIELKKIDIFLGTTQVSFFKKLCKLTGNIFDEKNSLISISLKGRSKEEYKENAIQLIRSVYMISVTFHQETEENMKKWYEYLRNKYKNDPNKKNEFLLDWESLKKNMPKSKYSFMDKENFYEEISAMAWYYEMLANKKYKDITSYTGISDFLGTINSK